MCGFLETWLRQDIATLGFCVHRPACWALPVSCRGLKHQGTCRMLESKQQPRLLHCSWVTPG
jgi:hypothetical protein